MSEKGESEKINLENKQERLDTENNQETTTKKRWLQLYKLVSSFQIKFLFIFETIYITYSLYSYFFYLRTLKKTSIEMKYK